MPRPRVATSSLVPLARTRRVVARIIVLCLAILYITASCGGERRRGTAHDEGSRTDTRIRHEREEEGNATYAVLPLLPVLLFFSSSLPPSSSPLSCSSLVQGRIDLHDERRSRAFVVLHRVLVYRCVL